MQNVIFKKGFRAVRNKKIFQIEGFMACFKSIKNILNK